jgi:KDO2-lipid IV(A) lauroyltransferase
MANILPKPALDAVAGCVAIALYCFSPDRRRTVRQNLEGIGIKPSRASIYGIFRAHTANIIEMVAASRWGPGRLEGRFEFEGKEALDAAIAEGKGVILITQHTGSWETGAVFLNEMGYRLHVVAGVQLSPLLTHAAKKAKEKIGIEVINPEDSSRKLIRALSSGGILALLVDGNVYTGGTEVVFFGRPMRLPEGPARLARASGAPILAGYCRRLAAGRYRIHLERIVSVDEIGSLSESEALARIYGAVERFIRENADQWIMFRPFWMK